MMKQCLIGYTKFVSQLFGTLPNKLNYKRFNLTPDIISSYFWDKMLLFLISTTVLVVKNILKQESFFSCYIKNKLLRFAYGEIAEYNQNLFKLEDLFDNDKS